MTLYEAAVDDEGAYLVSELVRGDDARPTLLEAGRLSDRDIVAIGIALCDALAHAHAQGVVHRDVKPSNVLVPSARRARRRLAKLTDFGVARVIGGDSLTRTGDVVGTAAYMAPEQAEGREAGAAADLYSLALVIYEALTGVNPVATGTAAQRARRLGAHLPPLRRQRRDLPRELGQGIDLALRPRPRERGTRRRAARARCRGVADAARRRTRAWSPARGRTRTRDRATRATERRGPTAASDGSPASRPAAADARRPRRAEPPDAAGAAGRARGSRAAAAAVAGRVAGRAPARRRRRSRRAAAPCSPAVLVAALPRIGWLALTRCCVGAAGGPAAAPGGGAGDRCSAALVPGAAAAAQAATTWPLSAGAPALGLVGLAGAWPALAARAATRLAPRGAGGASAGSGWCSPRRSPAPTSTCAGRRARRPPHVWTASLQHDRPRRAARRSSSSGRARRRARSGRSPRSCCRGSCGGARWPLRSVRVTSGSATVVSATDVAVIAQLAAPVTPRRRARSLGAVAGALVALAPAVAQTLA